jgi:hypothetical protein
MPLKGKAMRALYINNDTYSIEDIEDEQIMQFYEGKTYKMWRKIGDVRFYFENYVNSDEVRINLISRCLSALVGSAILERQEV